MITGDNSIVILRADLVRAMTAHARLDAPVEACGVIAGVDTPNRHIPMRNAARSSQFSVSIPTNRCGCGQS